MSLGIKKDDQVLVLSGKNKGDRRRVLHVIPSTKKAIVENVNFVVQHKKSRDPRNPGGRMERESPISLCKLMLICGKCGSPTRVGTKKLPDGAKVRICKKCKAEI
ncbi:50S ribosomal protein L24 [Candidatus Sumerlaeota bacterium]|nr:50S ribosomal protein L24 [Candidatus Sumerlaeota bacterium]